MLEKDNASMYKIANQGYIQDPSSTAVVKLLNW